METVTGAKLLGESGYWTLTSVTPPEFTPAMRAGSKGVKPGYETDSGLADASSGMEVT